MNSRDSAYYEIEQFQRAIEESKKEGAAAAASIQRKGKRGRDESDQRDDDNKRQRTKSGSSASSNEKVSENEEGADEAKAAASSAAKPVRGAAARNPHSKELRERDEKREKERADAAGRRKGRAERRRGDESDPSEESLSRTTSSKGNDQTHAETPPKFQTQAPQKISHHKKTGRPPARRGRLGRNQYTRDRDPRPSDTFKQSHNGTSPARSHNSKEDHDCPRINGTHNIHNGLGELGGNKSSKGRHMNPNRTTMNEMKRRVAGILEFISHTQIEMAAEVPLVPTIKTPPSSSSSSNVPPTTRRGRAPVTPPEEEQQKSITAALNVISAELKIEQFRELGSLEMMEVLTRRLMKWQGEYGKFGDK
ncbi:MAG: hypothetical protein Q9181_000915 [Wetmoreana brouardii]